MKTLEKQDFAKLLLSIYSNYMDMYQYDCFYDIPKIRKIDEDKKEQIYYLYFRKSGADMQIKNENIHLHAGYLNMNTICLCITFIPHAYDDNAHKYNIEILKDSDHFLN